MAGVGRVREGHARLPLTYTRPLRACVYMLKGMSVYVLEGRICSLGHTRMPFKGMRAYVLEEAL